AVSVLAVGGLLGLGIALWYNAEQRAGLVVDLGKARREREQLDKDIRTRQNERDALSKQVKLLDQIRRHTDYAITMRDLQVGWEEHDYSRVQESLERLRPRAREPDLRGFEWHYLWKQCHSELAWFYGRACIAFTTDGKFVVTGGKAHTLERGDVSGPKKEPRNFVGLQAEPTSAVFTPDGRWLAATSKNGKVSVWGAESGKLRRSWQAHKEAFHIASSPDSRLLVTAGDD